MIWTPSVTLIGGHRTAASDRFGLMANTAYTDAENSR